MIRIRRLQDSVPDPSETGWDPSWWPRDGASLPLEMVGYFFLVLGIATVVWLVWVYMRIAWQRTAPLRLFYRIGSELSLSREQMWWLWRVSRQQRLVSPITLLLSRATHDHHVQQFLHERLGVADDAVPRPLHTARRQLFEG